MRRGIQSTDMDIIWLVNKDAQEGKEYDEEVVRQALEEDTGVATAGGPI